MNNILFEMNQNLLKNKKVATKTRFYVLLCLFAHNERPIRASNSYFSKRLGVSIESIIRALRSLKNDDLVYIVNAQSFKRIIYIKHNAFITKKIDDLNIIDYNWLEEE
jgi:DNA-binding MarR family transcriptional regulator